MKDVPSFNIDLFIGCRHGYNGDVFAKEDVIMYVKAFNEDRQRRGEEICCVRLTYCTYIVSDYSENGYQLSVINYPRFPKNRFQLENYMLALAEYLLKVLQQNRVSVVTPERTILLESEGAEECP